MTKTLKVNSYTQSGLKALYTSVSGRQATFLPTVSKRYTLQSLAGMQHSFQRSQNVIHFSLWQACNIPSNGLKALYTSVSGRQATFLPTVSKRYTLQSLAGRQHSFQRSQSVIHFSLWQTGNIPSNGLKTLYTSVSGRQATFLPTVSKRYTLHSLADMQHSFQRSQNVIHVSLWQAGNIPSNGLKALYTSVSGRLATFLPTVS